MRKLYLIKPLSYIICLACFIFSCNRDNTAEIIGVSNELSAYEKYASDIASGRIDSSTFIYTRDGCYIYCNNSSNYNLHDITYISKLNSSNKVIWTFKYKKEPHELLNSGWTLKIMEASDGSILFALPYWIKNNGRDFILVKISPDGKKLWEKTFSFSEDDLICTISETSDKGFILAGKAGTVSDNAMMYKTNLIKINEIGDLVWNKIYDDSTVNFFMPQIILQTNDNGYFISFESHSNYLVKIKESSNSINYIDTDESGWKYLNVANDGGYIYIKIKAMSSSIQELLITKIDDSGNIIWKKEHWIYFPYVNRILHMSPMLNSGYFLLMKGNSAYSMLKFNNSGDIIDSYYYALN